jgi:tetratricopeptide (TPR) repeat protein
VDEARACIDKGFELSARDANAHWWLADAYAGLGLLDQAIACYNKAFELDPKLALDRWGLAGALAARGRQEEALACCREWFERSAHDANGTHRLADCYLWLGRLDDALACYKRAIELNPEDRYNAACCAATGGCGRGWLRPENGAARLDPAQRTRLRHQALTWLRAHLEAHRRKFEESGGKASPAVAWRMQYWLRDVDFAGVRGEEALAQLPPAERRDWERLWQEIEALRQRAAPEPNAARPAQP